MSTLEKEKRITQEFLENAINNGPVQDILDQIKNESEKLISDEITSDIAPEEDDIDSEKHISEESLTDSKPSETESLPNKTELETSITDSIEIVEKDKELEETESTRDLKSSERDISDEETVPEKSEHPREEWQNILGSGVIMKKILKEGEPDTRPNRSDKCFINYTCKLEEADDEDFAEKVENVEVGLGEGDVVQGLDVALGLMNRKERCLLKIGSRLAFGEKGLPPSIPPNANVMFDVELVDVTPEDNCESLSVRERRIIGNRKRQRGNWWYQRGENTLAVQCYRRALDFLDEVETENNELEKPSDAELQQLLEDRLKVLNNMASAQIKMELYDQALTSLRTVLKCQPDNVKALFRQAKIYSAKNDLPRSLKLLERARVLEPEDPLIIKEISVVNAIINKQKNSEREYARRMFKGASPGGSDSKTKVMKEDENSSSTLQVWATIGATVIIGIAGVIAYKFKYT